jgi:phosphate transport system protein
VTPADLDDLRADVVLVLAHVTEGVARATAAFLSADLADVERVVAGDDAVDDLNRRIEARVHDLLARHPDAGEVEVLVGILRTLHELELSGDLVVNIAKGARRIYPHPLDPKVRGLVDRMGRQAVEQLRLATDAFADRNPSLAAAVADMDTVMDDLTKDLLRAVFRAGAGDETAVQHAVQVALVGRYFERIGDHARIIAERVALPG